MSPAHSPARIPIWTWAAPAAALILLGLKTAQIVPPHATIVVILATALLGAAVFAAVHHAEVLALRLGEPFGSILLAIAVTVIEAALIVSMLVSGSEGSEAVARDTVFAAVMIVLNGIVGLCLVIGARRHYEQTFQLQAASSALAVLGVLAVIALVLPTYTLSAPGPIYAPAQLLIVGAVSLVLYCSFVFVQTVRHRAYFLEPGEAAGEAHGAAPTNKVTLASAILLPVSLTVIVLLAKVLSYPLDRAIDAAGLPQAFVGVVIAAIVLLPEGVASAVAAFHNRLQASLNLALGSAIASIGLTIPVVAVVAVAFGLRLELGLSSANAMLLMLTLFVSTLTLGTGKTTLLQGVVHLTIFAIFLMVAAIP